MTHTITSVVIPAAGKGTRLLPATKATPKELLNIYDRPALQFSIDEAIDLGVQRIVVVIHPDKAGIRRYLTPDRAFIDDLNASGKTRLGAALANIEVPDHIEIMFAEQPQPLGLGHAVLCAAELTLPGPFAVLLPDDLILGAPCLSEMADHYTGGHMIAAMEVQPEETSSYGIFSVAQASIGRSLLVSGMVEKPRPEEAPSCLAAVGRYILDPRIFARYSAAIALHAFRFHAMTGFWKGAGGEIQLTDAIAQDARNIALHAFRFSGTRFDCGCHDGLLDAAIARKQQIKGGRNGIAAKGISALSIGGKVSVSCAETAGIYQAR
jgi:UTP--glucose-1-phosphate uridylyltransferase